MKNDSAKNINHTLLTDFYELTMANGYFELGKKDEIAYFDLFFRKVPDEGGFAIFAGLEQVVEYLENLSFTEEDIEFLRSKKCFSEAFLEYLRDFKFECDVWAIPEGTPVFPYEPLITVRGPDHTGTVYRDFSSAHGKPSDSDRHKSQQNCARRSGTLCHGIRIQAGAGSGCGGLRSESGVYRRLHRHGMYHRRARFQYSGAGYDGSQLGSELRFGIRGFLKICRALSRQLRPARRHV